MCFWFKGLLNPFNVSYGINVSFGTPISWGSYRDHPMTFCHSVIEAFVFWLQACDGNSLHLAKTSLFNFGVL